MKVLQLTSSPVDHEALAAIRTANKMLETRGMMWSEIFEKKSAPVRPSQKTASYGNPDAINEMFRELLCDNMNPDAEDFVSSLYTQWRKFHRLSEKQVLALEKFYNNSVRRRAVYR